MSTSQTSPYGPGGVFSAAEIAKRLAEPGAQEEIRTIAKGGLRRLKTRHSRRLAELCSFPGCGRTSVAMVWEIGFA